jgi:hypothetical protein
MAAEIQLLSSMEKPRPPFRLFAGDITPEKLTEMLCEHHSLACIESESSLLPNIAGRYSNGEASTGTVNRAWSAEPLRFDRRGGQSFDCERSHFVWIAAAQPITLAELQTNPNLMQTGLTNRFLFSMPQDLLGRRRQDPPPIPQTLKDSWAQIVRDIAEQCGNFRTLTTCNEGRALIVQFGNDLEPRLGKGGDLSALSGWASKLRGNLIRLAAIFQLATDPTAKQLDPVTLQLAFDSVEYWIAHAKQVLNPTQSQESRNLLKKALEVSTPFANLSESLQEAFVSSVSVSEGVNVFSLRDLERTYNKQNAQVLRSKLQNLVREDLVRALPATSTRGRPSEWYALSPYAAQELEADQ